MWAAAYGQIGSAKMLLKAGANKNFQNSAGNSALHFAASCGHHDVVKLLLSQGADPNIVDEVF